MSTTIKPIRSEEEHERALARVEELWDAADGTEATDELEVLSILIEAYEKAAHPVPPPDPIDAVRFAMDQRGLRPKDLASIIGSSGRVSEVLGKRRTLTLAMIRRLYSELGIEPSVLIRPYRTAAKRRPAPKRGKTGRRR